MRLSRPQAARFLACLFLSTCCARCVLASIEAPPKGRQIRFLFASRTAFLPLAVYNLPAALPAQHLSRHFQCGRQPPPVHSPGCSAGAPAPLRSPRRAGSLLLSKLSFLTSPDPVTLGDEGAVDGGGTSKGSLLNRTLPQPYVEANSRYVRLSPIKTRRVIQELRGKTLAGALAHLATSPRRPALAIFRAIESALANAVNLHGEQNLKPQLVSVTANNGPVMKRPFFKARGKMDIRRRPTTHIKVIIKAF
ncbi:50S ribosomal protein L22, putative [Eimeria tenella]|uniref:50S ribosomal protein L22, putative n=1 Tax=Eimeria tenella TaxID=5802 RepID=U6L1U6_EIMTE|nr:50S ribosomal protein L22, putative [Eimeria tenella]CDJ42559.1 50S ribosomal protein L22, putative [Eimeria tenella]|eukprot:XP_013233309.1 50S ribosomal protein L22, putative [Eimeria tenella]